jgi:hypothetical protein
MNNQKVNILFWLRSSKKTSDGTAPLYARITIEGEDEPISLGLKIRPEYWDAKLKRDTEPSSAAKDNNLKIAKIELDLNAHLTILCSQHPKITLLMLKNVYLGLSLDCTSRIQKDGVEKIKLTLIKG